MRKGWVGMRIFLAALAAVAVVAASAWAGPASTYAALDGAVLHTTDNDQPVTCHFYGMDAVERSGLLVNEYDITAEAGEVVTREVWLKWTVRWDSVIEITGGNCFARSEGVLHRLESCAAQKLVPGDDM